MDLSNWYRCNTLESLESVDYWGDVCSPNFGIFKTAVQTASTWMVNLQQRIPTAIHYARDGIGWKRQVEILVIVMQGGAPVR